MNTLNSIFQWFFERNWPISCDLLEVKGIPNKQNAS